MQVLKTFDPTASASGSFDMTVKNGSHIVVANESSANLLLTFGNGAQTYVPANDKRLYCISGQMAQPHTTVLWSRQSSLPQPNTVNQTVVEVYQPGENVPEVYPSPLIRNTAVAGPITATKLTLNVPIFNGGPGTTNVIEVFDTPGSGIRYITMDNLPSLTMYTNQNGLTSPMITLGNVPPSQQWIILNSDGSAFFGQNGSGQTHFDNTGNLIQSTGTKIVTQLIDATAIPSGAADLGFHVAAANRVVDTVNGVDTFSVNSAGANLLAGTLKFLTGSLSRLSFFGPYTLSTTATFFNHNLGVVPDVVLLQIVGTSSTAEMAKYDNTTMTSTQVKLVSNGAFLAVGIAMKF